MISYYLPSGSKIGVGYQVNVLAEELVRRGHTVDVFSECPPVPGAAYGHQRVELAGSLRTFRFALALRHIDFGGYDVLHAHGDDYWMSRRRPARVRTMHGSCFDEALHIRGAKERVRMLALGVSEVLASLLADRTVLVSPGTRRWTPWVRTVVPNCVNTARFRPDPARRANHPVVLFVGTWGGRKRGGLLAAQFQRHVRAALPEAELWMVTEQAPADPGPGVRVLGRLSDMDLADCYQQAWVFCLPSSYEGFGIPYIEAMASGLPVVATPNLGARYIIADGSTGLLAGPRRLGPVLVGLLTDRARREKLAAAGLGRAAEFGLDRVVTRYESIYRDLIATRRPG
jgi:glycosyltransferase involved in cell wall biosynthesis